VPVPDATPYYDDGTCRIYHGDCREVDAWDIASGVLVTDPPYGMSYVSNFSRYGSTDPIIGDEGPLLRDEILARWGDRPALVFGTWRVSRPNGVRELIVWDKGETPGMGDLSLPWGPAHEEIYVLGSGFKGKRRPNVIRCPTIPAGSYSRPAHPTPKPLSLMTGLVTYCPPGAEVVDPFMGSGTTLRAAKDCGRRAIGVEVDERYCEIAAKRLAQEVLDFGGAGA
jgi:site-specific DNA-methyltransferase (adenine-specific)